MDIILFLKYTLLVYLGTVCYVIAAYYHLSLHTHWTFLKAFMIAIPIVMAEYCFSLNGNYYLHSQLKLSAMDILIMTICFYFVNLWLLNYFVLKNKVKNVYKELFCFILIISAFLLTSVIE